jgi:hypothetical protein
MDAPPKSPPAIRQHGGLTGALKANQTGFQIAAIILWHNEKEDPEMNIEELRGKSSAEIRDIYNTMAERSIKRFSDRTEAEKRTAILLQEAGQWEGDLPGGPKKANGAAKAAPAKAGKAKGKAEAAPAAAATGRGKKATETKSEKPAKPEKVAKKAGNTRTIPPRGAPRTNLLYVAQKHTNRMNEGSARTIVYRFVETKGANGIDRESIENNFVDNEAINVKASLDYLVKFGMLKTKEAK